MVAAPQPLSPDEFHSRFSGAKPSYEYWFGEAIQKSLPALDHSVLQGLLTQIFRDRGFRSGSETELRVNPDWEPVPDVIAYRGRLERPYPTTAPEIVVEILSPDDRMSHMIRKCREYVRLGVGTVFVLDPMQRDGWRWNANESRLDGVQMLSLPNATAIDLPELWQRLDAELD